MRKSWREKYFEDYEAVEVDANNRKGYKIEYIYVGKWFFWTEDGNLLKNRKIKYCLLAGLSTIIFILCGICNTPINTYAAVAIPAVVSVVTLMYEWIGVIGFCVHKNSIREPDIKKIYSHIETFSALTACIHAAVVIISIIFCIINKLEVLSWAVAIALAISATLSWYFHKYHQKLKYVEVTGPKISYNK